MTRIRETLRASWKRRTSGINRAWKPHPQDLFAPWLDRPRQTLADQVKLIGRLQGGLAKHREDSYFDFFGLVNQMGDAPLRVNGR